MSVLNKVPFINSVLNELGEENLGTLRSLMNGSGDRTELLRTTNVPAGNRVRISAADKGVHLCSLQVGPTLYHGYLLYKEKCVLIHFTDFQSLSIFEIDVAHNQIHTVSEYLDINELRYIVNDLLMDMGELIHVQVDDIESGTEPEGKAIVSDGEGGAKWGDIIHTIETNDITQLTKAQLDSLKAGDVVNKITGNEKHSYHVSYKGTGAGTGICLTYEDASRIETVSYDRSGDDWVYNSTDVKEVLGKNEDIQVNGITSKGIANTGAIGNIGDVAINGDLSVSGSINGEENPSVKPIYCHPLMIYNQYHKYCVCCFVFNNDSTPFTLESFKTWFADLYTAVGATIRVLLTGGYKSILAVSLLGYNGTNYFIIGKGADGEIVSLQSSSLDFFDDATTTFTDGVNKIN